MHSSDEEIKAEVIDALLQDTRIKNGVIEELGPARIVQKTPDLVYQDGGSVAHAMPSFKDGEYGLKYRLHIEGDPEHILKNQTFRIHRQDGSVTEGITDENGESQLLSMHELENATLELITGVRR